MEEHNYEIDLYPEALRLFKSRVTNLNKIRELLEMKSPNNSEAVETAIVKLKAYRKSAGLRSLLIGIVLLPVGIFAAMFLMNRGGLIEMALIGALIGGGIGLLGKGAAEYIKMK